VDGSSTKDGSDIDLIVEIPQVERHEHSLKFMSKASNNEAAYKALIEGMELCYTTRADSVR